MEANQRIVYISKGKNYPVKLLLITITLNYWTNSHDVPTYCEPVCTVLYLQLWSVGEG